MMGTCAKFRGASFLLAAVQPFCREMDASLCVKGRQEEQYRGTLSIFLAFPGGRPVPR